MWGRAPFFLAMYMLYMPFSASAGVIAPDYDGSAVYRLNGYLGYATMIVTGAPIKAATLGDPGGWVVEPIQSSPNMVSVKPALAGSNTNLSLVDEKGRVYSFGLAAFDAPLFDYEVTDRIEFRYAPEPEAVDPADSSSEPDPASLNFAYSYRGDAALRPLRAFDDGVKTYLQFPENRRVPAIFTVAADGSEAIVNVHRAGRYFVVHSVAAQFTLRDGPVRTCLYNKGFGPAAGYDAASPALEGQHD